MMGEKHQISYDESVISDTVDHEYVVKVPPTPLSNTLPDLVLVFKFINLLNCQDFPREFVNMQAWA